MGCVRNNGKQGVTTETLTATEFKAKCLDVLHRIEARAGERVIITKRGRIVAVLVPPETEVAHLHGFLFGSVTIPAAVDITEPLVEQMSAVTSALLYR